jgi:ATP-dependent RNA helicase HelY
MPPSIHPVDLITALRQKHLTPAIVFLTSRRACDEAMQAFDHSNAFLDQLNVDSEAIPPYPPSQYRKFR